MLRNLQKVESHTRVSDLQSEWTKKKQLRDMVSVVSVKRLRGLTHTSNGSVSGIPHTQTNEKIFHSRNQTVAPNTLDDRMGRDLTESAMKGNASSVIKTQYAGAFNTHAPNSRRELNSEGRQELMNVQTDPALTAPHMIQAVDKSDQSANDGELLQNELNEVGSV